MMAYLLHFTSSMSLWIRFVNPLLSSDKFWQHKFHNSKAALDLLMGPSSKSINFKTIHPIILGLMGEKKCIAWTTRLWQTTMGYLFINLDLRYVGSYHDINIFPKSSTSTSHNINILSTHMNILSIYWVTLVTWMRKCSWCVTLGGMNWRLKFLWMLLTHTTKCMQVWHFIWF